MYFTRSNSKKLFHVDYTAIPNVEMLKKDRREDGEPTGWFPGLDLKPCANNFLIKKVLLSYNNKIPTN